MFISISMNVLIQIFEIHENNSFNAKLFIKIFKVNFIITQQLLMSGVVILVSLISFKLFVLQSNFTEMSLYLFIVLMGGGNLQGINLIS